MAETQLRDMTNPSGADIEAYINRRLSALGQFQRGGEIITAGEFDFKVEEVKTYPGPNWILTEVIAFPNNMTVYILWRMSRVKQAELGINSHMPLTKLA